jgi:hypothetical protein
MSFEYVVKYIGDNVHLLSLFIHVSCMSKLLDSSVGRPVKMMFSEGANFMQEQSCGIAMNIILDSLGLKFNSNDPKIKLMDLKMVCENAQNDQTFVIKYENTDHVAIIYYHKESKIYSLFQSFTYYSPGNLYNNEGYFLHNYSSKQHTFNDQILKKNNSFCIDIDIFIDLMNSPDNLKYLSCMPQIEFPSPSIFSIILCETKVTGQNILSNYYSAHIFPEIKMKYSKSTYGMFCWYYIKLQEHNKLER